MLICDRCHTIDGSVKIATDEIQFKRYESKYGICESCRVGIVSFLQPKPNKKKKGGRPKKDK